MNVIKKHVNLNEFDTLDGRELEDGESLRIKWPDGFTEVMPVIVKETTREISDNGTPHVVSIRRAYFNVKYHGAKRWFLAEGLFAERVIDSFFVADWVSP